MTQTPLLPAEHAGQVHHFREHGYVVIPNALSEKQVKDLNRGVDKYLEQFPAEWAHFSESLIQTVDVLPRVDDFDSAIENPLMFPLLKELLGENFSFEELSIILRNPTSQSEDVKSWHRDIIRDFNRRHEISAISIVYYLTDVTDQDHCFSIIPGTHDRLLDLRPEHVTPDSEVDLTGPAGTALIFHARCIHAGKLKPQSRQRRTLHLYFDRSDAPRTSEWTTIPARLYTKTSPALPPKLYSKWNVTEIVEGTGRKPEGVNPALSTAELLMEVQRRANRKP